MGDRRLVIVLGDEPLDLLPFQERKLTAQRVTEREVQGLLRRARALLISEPAGKFESIRRYFQDVLRPAREHGLMIAVLVHSERDLEQVRAIKNASNIRAEVFYRTQIPVVAEEIAREYASPEQDNDAEIELSSVTLSHEDQILMRRAFYDCTRICLEPLVGGKRSTNVFRVYAWIKGSEVGPRPLPFFAKLADPGVIEKERHNYRNYAELYVPFNLRPNLVRRRCVAGHRSAALVGNFVEDALPLRRSLRENIAGTALFSLFETTLKGFRLQPFVSGNKSSGLDQFIRDRAKADQVPDEIQEFARDFGLQTSAQELQEELCEEARKIQTWRGPIHGDLHAHNVMVRHGDAIIIDFASVNHGPLTADPATLEVSLVFGTDDADSLDELDQWFALVKDVYATVPLIRPLNPASEVSGCNWLRQAVRDVRHILFACDTARHEAAIVLASYLIRFSRLRPEQFKNPDLASLAVWRHAYALRTAERIVQAIRE